MNLNGWATRWNIPTEAILDLKVQMGLDGQLGAGTDAQTETGATKRIRLAEAKHGNLLFRNNTGAFQDERGRWIRFGIGNDSKAMNDRIKFPDLIGIKKGGQFFAREVKRPGWKFIGTDREVAQLKGIELLISKGADAAFSTGEET